MARQSLGVPADARVLLFASEWLENQYKGLPTLLQALEILKTTPCLHLVTVGNGKVAHCPIAHTSLGVVVDEQRMSLAYNAADLFVLPSVQDNFPNTALEALACGLPIVGSRVGGIPEIVRQDCTGTLFEAGDADALAAAIRKLLMSPDRLGQMSIECRRVAVEEYSLEVQAKRYADLYSSLLVSSPSSAKERDADSLYHR